MFTYNPIHATLPAADLNRAKRFYAEKLGLLPESEIPGGVFFRCGLGTRFLVYLTDGVPSGTHTQIGWTVSDIDTEVANLKRRGLVFEEYDTPTLKTEKSIAKTKAFRGAWFKDSEGNLHGIVQFN